MTVHGEAIPVSRVTRVPILTDADVSVRHLGLSGIPDTPLPVTPFVAREDSSIDIPAEWYDAGAEGAHPVAGDCMTQAGIRDGDYVAVHLQSTASDGDVVVAASPDGQMVKTYRCRSGRAWLVPSDPGYHSVAVDDDVTILGVVIVVIQAEHE